MKKTSKEFGDFDRNEKAPLKNPRGYDKEHQQLSC
jgi:hypothetical protein